VESLSAHFPHVRVASISSHGSLVWSSLPLHLRPLFATLAHDPTLLRYSQLNAALAVPAVPDLPVKVKAERHPWFDVDRVTTPPLRHYALAARKPDGFATGPLAEEGGLALPRVWLSAAPAASAPASPTPVAARAPPAASLPDDAAASGDQGLLVYSARGVSACLLYALPPLPPGSPPQTPATLAPEAFQPTGRTLPPTGASAAADDADESVSASAALGAADLARLQQLQLFLATNVGKIAEIIAAEPGAAPPAPQTEAERRLELVRWLSVNPAIGVRSARWGAPGDEVLKCVNRVFCELRGGDAWRTRQASAGALGLRAHASEYLDRKQAAVAARRRREERASAERERVRRELEREAREQWEGGRAARRDARVAARDARREERRRLRDEHKGDAGREAPAGEEEEEQFYDLEDGSGASESEDVEEDEEYVVPAALREPPAEPSDDEADYEPEDFLVEWADVFAGARGAAVEVVARCEREHVWVLGRRGLLSERELYLLLEERHFPSLVDVQQAVDAMAKLVFHNVFIY
jgi:hypothetical protein